MTPRCGRGNHRAEQGFALIEVLVSGLIAVIAATGIMALMSTSVHSAGDQRQRSQSYGLAQEDQARLRSMRIATLKTLSGTSGEQREVTLNGTKYTIVSRASFVSDATSAASCGTSADYIRTSTEVTWPNMSPTPMTTLRSIVSPPTEALKPRSGNLSVFVKNAAGAGVAGVGISGSGPSTISGSTDTTGCALFTEVMEGTYSITPSGTNLVDKDGAAPAATVLSVNPESTATLELQYDKYGSVPIEFKTLNYESVSELANPEQLIAYNTGMTSAKVFGKSGVKLTSTAAPIYSVTPLFPFSSTDAFYAGACTTNNPGTGTAIVNATVPAGTAAATQTLTMPSLLLNVQKTEGTTVTKLNGVTVKITDKNCATSPINTRAYSTATVGGSAGRLAEPELPWGTYEVCAAAPVTSGTTTKTRRIIEEIPVKEKVSKTFNLTSTSTEGVC